MSHLEQSWAMEVGDHCVARVITTDRSHGDLAIDSLGVDGRRRAVVNAEWTWLRQVHGDEVVTVTEPGGGAGSEADAAWTRTTGAVLAVQVADCAPVALIAGSGAVGIAHAGWRGLLGGVLEATVSAMQQGGAEGIVGVLGPCIRPAHYAFGEPDLAVIEDRLGVTVRSETELGSAALDMPAAVEASLRQCGVPLVAILGGCTAADAERRWSHRARGDRERQAMVVWMEAAALDD